jgi:SNF2 family DNA or RNA helicase
MHECFTDFMKMKGVNLKMVDEYVRWAFTVPDDMTRLKYMIDDVEFKFKKVSNNIDKVKESLMDTQYCGVCAEDIRDSKLDIGILNCSCNYACCVNCINSVINKTTLSGKCPKCRSDFNIKSVMFIGTQIADEFDNLEDSIKTMDQIKIDAPVIINKVKQEDFKKDEILMRYLLRTNIKREVDPPLGVDEVDIEQSSDTYEERMLSYLRKFEGKGLNKRADQYFDIDEGTVIHTDIKGLMRNKDVEGKIPVDGEYKIIVFASHDETLARAEARMKEFGIPFLRIQGDYKQIGAQVRAFDSNKVNVLTINNTKYSSGLHLISANHVIMLHKIHSDAEKSQLCGRIVRIGQTWQPKIVTIAYDTE